MLTIFFLHSRGSSSILCTTIYYMLPHDTRNYFIPVEYQCTLIYLQPQLGRHINNSSSVGSKNPSAIASICIFIIQQLSQNYLYDFPHQRARRQKNCFNDTFFFLNIIFKVLTDF